MKIPSYLAFIFVLLLSGSSLLVGQQTADTMVGLVPYKSYAGGDLDSIGLGSGSLTLHIPVYSVPERGKNRQLSYSLYYNGDPIQVQNVCDPYGCYQNWEATDVNVGPSLSNDLDGTTDMKWMQAQPGIIFYAQCAFCVGL